MVVDELKVHFGLDRVQGHSCIYEGKLYRLNKVHVSTNSIDIPDYNLYDMLESGFAFDDRLSDLIRWTFVFRELVGIHSTTNANIILRTIDGRTFPLSVGESDVVEDTELRLPNTVKARWFAMPGIHPDEQNYDQTIGKLVTVFFGVTAHEQINGKLAELRFRMEETVNRVDRSAIGVVGKIIDRAMTHLHREFPWNDNIITMTA
jgi:hypothetical protein